MSGGRLSQRFFAQQLNACGLPCCYVVMYADIDSLCSCFCRYRSGCSRNEPLCARISLRRRTHLCHQISGGWLQWLCSTSCRRSILPSRPFKWIMYNLHALLNQLQMQCAATQVEERSLDLPLTFGAEISMEPLRFPWDSSL